MNSSRLNIDFKAIASAALARVDTLLAQWLPGGVIESGEYKALNPLRSDEKKGSFSINIHTGAWADFATADKGGDLVSLYAYLNNLDQLQAAKMVAEMVGIAKPQTDTAQNAKPPQPAKTDNVIPISKTKAAPPRTLWRPLLPAPLDGVGPPPVAHYKRGQPQKVWTYRAADGAVNGFIYLFLTSEGEKETLPVCFAEHTKTKEREWRWMAFPEPRPLYGLERLHAKPDSPVLLVEGEKCADLAQVMLPDFVVVTWPGGCKAVKKIDWQPLAGRAIWAWADCDAQRVKLSRVEKDAGVDPDTKPLLSEAQQPGMRAMLTIRDALINLNDAVNFNLVDIPPPDSKLSGWDIVDAINNGMDSQALKTFIEKVRPKPSGADSQNGKPIDKKKSVNWDRVQDLFDHYALIYSTDTCIDIPKRLVMKIANLRLSAGPVNVKIWLDSEDRRMILPSQLVFDPSGNCEAAAVNLFDGLPMIPKKGDFAPIMELLNHLCADSAPTPEKIAPIVAWVLKWLALPLQKLGTKMRSALVFHGPQGAGKNLFFEVIAAIYGRYGLVVGQDQIEDKFNDWLSQRLFVIADEVIARQELYHQKNKIKSLITGETIQINPKNLPLRTEANHVNLAFLSNEHQPIALEVGDRRFMVVYTPPMRQDDLYQRVADCIAGGGVEAFYHYLMHLPLDGYTEFDLPPMTEAKKDLIELGLRPPERFVREWLSGSLPLPLRVCSVAQLFRVFKIWAAANGERFVPNQSTFTKMAKKTVEVLSARINQPLMLRYKVSKLVFENDGQKTERVFIPHDQKPPDHLSEGAWVTDEIKQFEFLIRHYSEKSGGQSQ